ncbi:hypothetical protein ACDX41_24980, partial [Citrobacter meridianamericanus]
MAQRLTRRAIPSLGEEGTGWSMVGQHRADPSPFRGPPRPGGRRGTPPGASADSELHRRRHLELPGLAHRHVQSIGTGRVVGAVEQVLHVELELHAVPAEAGVVAGEGIGHGVG